MADNGDTIQGGNRQVILPQQLLQQPDQNAENTEVGRSAVGHQLVVTLGRPTHEHTRVRIVDSKIIKLAYISLRLNAHMSTTNIAGQRGDSQILCNHCAVALVKKLINLEKGSVLQFMTSYVKN